MFGAGMRWRSFAAIEKYEKLKLGTVTYFCLFTFSFRLSILPKPHSFTTPKFPRSAALLFLYYSTAQLLTYSTISAFGGWFALPTINYCIFMHIF
jgi:hypothetical protein